MMGRGSSRKTHTRKITRALDRASVLTGDLCVLTHTYNIHTYFCKTKTIVKIILLINNYIIHTRNRGGVVEQAKKATKKPTNQLT